nr:immunoglobulin light chain junction region [Macaca mulatta]MPO07864.1 immunoglobulin light chain junction region [Macaca mulatta]MPO11377.1 immunoglobulin light chain junction region [Macaca mulatta]MPO12284.1 immunoglobulin light chain junction region [Macaca mulatta]MPO12589.1 immunoglobulin light chain junction region [Macaca mulatta]
CGAWDTSLSVGIF